MQADDPLYPADPPFRTGQLAVGEAHRLYYAEFGDPDGLPALFLHGGPGSGCNPRQARLFDPRGFRLVQLDQRGCGRSQPPGAIGDNDIQALLADLEALRRHLAIERWLLYGGSWGGTLAIEYAKRHAQHLLCLVLRAPFLARREDLEWFTRPSGVARALPDAYADLCAGLDCRIGDDLTGRLHQRLCDPADPRLAYRAALAWDTWEAAVMGLPSPAADADDAGRAARVARKRVFAHFCRHRFFLGDAGVLPGIDRLGAVVGTLVHGTADRVCRYPGSRQLVETHLPGFTLETVAGAGHGLHETALQAALRNALDTVLRRHGQA